MVKIYTNVFAIDYKVKYKNILDIKTLNLLDLNQ